VAAHLVAFAIGRSASVIQVLVDDIDRLAREVEDMKVRCRRLRNGTSVSSSTTIARF
jgi:hypothetical protein